MPYSAEHKKQVRKKIIESARILFNRHGFEEVTIDKIMNFAGLTRGGFYNHFSSKNSLYSEAISSFLMGRGAQWRKDAGVTQQKLTPNIARQMIKSYLSPQHLQDLDGQCPMIALPSDVARARPEVQTAYQKLLESMVLLFEKSLEQQKGEPRQKALSLAALCVGGMVLARTLPDSELANEIQQAALTAADEITYR